MVYNTWQWEVYPHIFLTKNILTYDRTPDTWFCKIKRIYIILSFNNRYPHINSWIHKYGYRNYWQWMRVPAAEYTFILRFFIVLYVILFCCLSLSSIINYPLLSVADTGIYQHAVLHYKTGPNVNTAIAVLSYVKLPYPRMHPRIANLSHAQLFWLIASV